MKKYFFLFYLVTATFLAKAHQPDLSSTLLVEQQSGEWLLQIRASLTAFEYEIENQYGQNAYTTPEEFQELVLDHVKENIFIKINQEGPVKIRNSQVKIGHETHVFFEMEDIPKDIYNIAIKNSSFKNITRNQSALVILKNGVSKDQFVLDGSNRHSIELAVDHSKFTIVSNAKTSLNARFVYKFLGVLFIVSILLATLLSRYKRRNVSL